VSDVTGSFSNKGFSFFKYSIASSDIQFFFGNTTSDGEIYQDWKELPVDLLTLGLYYLQNLENYEILRGRSSIGNYHLKKEFSRAYISPSDVVFPKKIVCPDVRLLSTINLAKLC
jgi:hypothetical protein